MKIIGQAATTPDHGPQERNETKGRDESEHGISPVGGDQDRRTENRERKNPNPPFHSRFSVPHYSDSTKSSLPRASLNHRVVSLVRGEADRGISRGGNGGSRRCFRACRRIRVCRPFAS